MDIRMVDTEYNILRSITKLQCIQIENNKVRLNETSTKTE